MAYICVYKQKYSTYIYIYMYIYIYIMIIYGVYGTYMFPAPIEPIQGAQLGQVGVFFHISQVLSRNVAGVANGNGDGWLTWPKQITVSLG